jgi:hypothetical protein
MTMVRIGAIVVLAACGPVLAQEADRAWGSPEELCSIADERVSESSGIAASSKVGVFFTHNDSGDEARFFRFDRTGKVDGVYTLKDVEAIDWEDMSSAKVDGKDYLYFGDFGDNGEDRESVIIHRVPEPTTTGEVEVTAFESYTLKYPDSPHNCEAMFVTTTGDIWVVTKNVGGNSKVFVLPRPKGTGSFTFKHIGDLTIDTSGFGGKYVTGGAVSPDGKFVVLRTYSAALEFAAPAKFEDWVKSEPQQVRTALEQQGEAICYSKNGKSLITTSEFSPCPVSILQLKGPKPN